jgi:hypothetical protein
MSAKGISREQGQINSAKARAAITAALTTANEPLKFGQIFASPQVAALGFNKAMMNYHVRELVKAKQLRRKGLLHTLINGADTDAPPSLRHSKNPVAVAKERGKKMRLVIHQALGNDDVKRGELLERITALGYKMTIANLSQYLLAMSKEGSIMSGPVGWIAVKQGTATPAPANSDVWIEYILHVGTTQMKLTEAKAVAVVQALTGRLRI